MRHTILAIVALVGLTTAPAFGAIVYDYSYRFSNNNLLSGTLEGTLQGDNNSVVVTGVGATFLNGTATRPAPFFDSLTNLQVSNGALPTVSLNGALMNLAVCTAPGCGNGFGFGSGGLFVSPVAVADPDFGDTGGGMPEAYVAERWSMAAQAPVPATAALVIAGLLGLRLGSRWRKDPM
jgi:hypothetical protein